MKCCFIFLLVGVAFAAEKVSVSRLIEMSRQNPAPAEFREAVAATLGEADIKKGTAVIGEGPDFFWAVESTMTPVLVVDDDPPWTMQRVKDSDIWFHAGRLAAGTSHMFHYVIGGAPFGGKNDVAAYLSESYAHANVPQGKLSEKIVHTSKIYPGMETNYWIYVPAQYDPKTPAALMVWQDGEGHINRDGGSRVMNVVDNLIYEGRIPVMIQVFISPGVVGEKKMRSIEYDTVDDRYDRFLRDEILADVEKQYNLRQDSYSRAIAGSSSGGICSFNAAWFHPELFSRVLSRIGSFTSIQWHPGVIDGGNVYPFKIRKEAKRNIRVWLQDGSNDLENEHGSWPLQNIEMANSLKRQGYDFHLSFGTGTHNGAHGNSEAPLELAWLWRDYDPAKTEQTYQMEPTEAAKPLFRVRLVDR
jgi:enterochelin esterase family protein